MFGASEIAYLHDMFVSYQNVCLEYSVSLLVPSSRGVIPAHRLEVSMDYRRALEVEIFETFRELAYLRWTLRSGP